MSWEVVCKFFSENPGVSFFCVVALLLLWLGAGFGVGTAVVHPKDKGNPTEGEFICFFLAAIFWPCGPLLGQNIPQGADGRWVKKRASPGRTTRKISGGAAQGEAQAA
jgi:hypothetical protein